MTIQTVNIPQNTIVDIYTTTAIPVGTSIQISTQSMFYSTFLKESATEPTMDTEDAEILSSIQHPRSVVVIPQGSSKIWAFSLDGSLKLTIQVL